MYSSSAVVADTYPDRRWHSPILSSCLPIPIRIPTPSIGIIIAFIARELNAKRNTKSLSRDRSHRRGQLGYQQELYSYLNNTGIVTEIGKKKIIHKGL